MIRKLAIAITLVSAGYSGALQALGLGEATVSSNLNQPLVAEIDITNTGGLSDTEILPGLATREEFLRAGIDRVYFLSDIRFEVETDGEGQAKIVLTTKRPVREPFLNFLVEVIWPSGRLLREYALLIDPPVFAEDKPVAAAPAQVAPQAPAQVTQAPVARTQQGDNVAVRQSAQPRSGALAGSNTYGPTDSSDTLWEIATKVRPDSGVSPQQVMLAIQDLNPNAFIDGNINKLKTGQVLRIPTREQMASRSGYAAINEVIEQNAALRKPKTATPVSTAKSDAPVSPASASQGGDQLKLVVPEKDSKASDAASSDPSGTSEVGTASNEELAVTLEKLDKANLENEELTDKVDSLEEQLETLQRILTLKNDQLAGLQAQMRAGELEQAQLEEEAELAQESGENVLPADVAEAMPGDDMASDELPAEQLAEGSVETNDESALTEDSTAAEAAPEQEVAEAPAPVTAPVQPSTPAAPAPVSMVDDLLNKLANNVMYQGILVGGLILLLILLWVFTRKKEEHEEQETYETDADESYEQEDAPEYEEPPELTDADHFEEEEAPVSDSAEEKEDVIAEADVYIAYGRLDQAASILEEGISNDPIRVDYRLKLLEVYRDASQLDAFDKQVSELEAIQDQDALSRASEIRAELLENMASQDSDDAEPSDVEHLLDEEEGQALLKGEDDNNFDFDTVEPTEDPVPDTDDAVADDLDTYVEEAVDEVSNEIDFESEDLDVDLDIDLDIDDVDELEPTSEVESDPGIDFESVDLSGGLDEALDEDAVSDEERNELEMAEDLDLETEIDLDLSEELELADDAPDLETELDALSDDDETLVDEALLDEVEPEIDSPEDLSLDTTEDQLELDAELTDAESEDLSFDGDLDADVDADDLALDLDDEAPDLGIDEDALDEAALEADALDVEDGADVLDIDADDLEITDETLDEAAEALGDADDFEPELKEDEDFDFLEGTDEASTKLDLARAYIDMGDVEGAREILEEVEKDGSAEQQQQAKDLIASLGE